MDDKSKIRGSIEKALKSEPEFLGEKKLVFFENEEVDWSKERTDVEAYIEDGVCSDTYHVHVCGVEYVAGISYAIKKSLKGKFKEALVSCSGTVEDDCILVTITM